jgi:hypothetical protein
MSIAIATVVVIVVIFFFSCFSTSLGIQDDIALTVSSIASIVTVASISVKQAAIVIVVATISASVALTVVLEVLDFLFGVPCELFDSLNNSSLLFVNCVFDVVQSGTEHVQ